MIKIYKNFFDSDCLKYIEKSIERSMNTSSLRTSYFRWPGNIILESTPVIIHDLFDADILLKPLKEIIDIEEDVYFGIYFWPVGSYIPWHDDGHTKTTATIYCNRQWEKDWGGLFLYEEGEEILAEVPEWNKLVVQSENHRHCTTSVTKPYYTPVAVNGINRIDYHPIIRTTIQIFTKKNGDLTNYE